MLCDLAPILLIAYNRPNHFKKTLLALAKNEKAKESTLFISIDGPINKDDKKSQEIIFNEIKLAERSFAKINIIKNKNNKGLSKNITDSVSQILSLYNKIIVLEDDLITAKSFILFMNNALNYYQDKKKIWHITGCNIAKNNFSKKDEIFLSRFMCCWGWATWKDRWEQFHKNPEILMKEFNKKMIYKFNIEGAFNFWDQIIENKEGKINTWAVFWYYIIFSKGGLCVIPWISYVKNIGFDGSGTNCPEINTKQELDNLNQHGKFVGISDIKENKVGLKIIKTTNKRSYLKSFLVKFLNNIMGYYNFYKVKSLLKKISATINSFFLKCKN